MNLNDFVSYVNGKFGEDLNCKDFCINGLQIGDLKSKKNISKLVTGVNLELELIEKAIEEKADAIIVHHGLFWNYQNHDLTGLNYDKVSALVKNDIALLGYHLPLDINPLFGNNVSLFLKVVDYMKQDLMEGYKAQSRKDDDPVSIFEVFNTDKGEYTCQDFVDAFKNMGLNVRATYNPDSIVKTVGICTGGGQRYFNTSGDYDLFITGEPGLPQSIMAKESGIAFVAAGHHDTEMFGVKNLGERLSSELGVEHKFIDIPIDA